MLRSFFNTLIEFAGDCWGRDATGPIAARLPCSGYDETAQAIALGGASLAQEFRGDRSGPRNLNDESTLFHVRKDAA